MHVLIDIDRYRQIDICLTYDHMTYMIYNIIIFIYTIYK